MNPQNEKSVNLPRKNIDRKPVWKRVANKVRITGHLFVSLSASQPVNGVDPLPPDVCDGTGDEEGLVRVPEIPVCMVVVRFTISFNATGRKTHTSPTSIVEEAEEGKE